MARKLLTAINVAGCSGFLLLSASALATGSVKKWVLFSLTASIAFGVHGIYTHLLLKD